MNTKEYNKQYYLNNRERIRKQQNIKELERYHMKKDKEGIEARRKAAKERTSHPCYKMYHAAKTRATQSGIEFSIDLTDLVVPEVCPITLKPFVYGEERSLAPSLDRIDNSKGYRKDNIRIISTFANSRKGSLSLEEIERLYLYTKSIL